MKIRMLKTAAGPDGVLAAGAEYEVDLEFGQALVMADAALWLEAPQPGELIVEQAVDEPVIETAERRPRRRKAAK